MSQELRDLQSRIDQNLSGKANEGSIKVMDKPIEVIDQRDELHGGNSVLT